MKIYCFIVALHSQRVANECANEQTNERSKGPTPNKVLFSHFSVPNPFAIPNERERQFTRNQTDYTPLATTALLEMIYLSMAQQIKEFEIKINIITFAKRPEHTFTCSLLHSFDQHALL